MTTLEHADGLCTTDRELLTEIKGLIRQFLPAATVLLYGSTARGTRDPESDYDLLLLTDEPLGPEEEERMGEAIYALELEKGVVISDIVHTKAQWDAPPNRATPFHRQVERDCIVL